MTTEKFNMAGLRTIDGAIIQEGKFAGFKLIAQSSFGLTTDLVNVYSRNGRCIGYLFDTDIESFISGKAKALTPEPGWNEKWSNELIDLFELKSSPTYQAFHAAATGC